MSNFDNKSLYFLDAREMADFVKKHPLIVSSVVVAGAGLFLIKRYFSGGVCYSKAVLTGKTVIVTGANTGIGLETARDFSRRGARVILACRDLTKAERAAAKIRRSTTNEDVVVKVVDLASLKSVKRFCDDVLASEKRIDILVNNAGIMACPQWQSEDGFELQFAVNHLGHYLLTNLLLERIKATENSRIVNVSSLAHEKGKMHFDDLNLKENYHPWRAYSQSKLANVLFTRELHNKLKGSTTTAYSLHPGVVNTELGKHLALPTWKRVVGLPLLWLLFKTPAQGAQTSLYCALQEGIEQHSGKYFSDCRVKPFVPQASDDVSAARLWDVSAALVYPRIHSSKPQS